MQRFASIDLGLTTSGIDGTRGWLPTNRSGPRGTSWKKDEGAPIVGRGAAVTGRRMKPRGM